MRLASNGDMAFTLSSRAFADGADVPARHTCDAEDLSPPLSWTGTPAGTRSFALIMDDPDAPRGTFTHWVMYNVPPDTTSFGEGATPGTAGRNSFGRNGYGGPCPPPGDPPHRYRFSLYALDLSSVTLEMGTREELEGKMQTHILATALLVGRYQRQKVGAR